MAKKVVSSIQSGDKAYFMFSDMTVAVFEVESDKYLKTLSPGCGEWSNLMEEYGDILL